MQPCETNRHSNNECYRQDMGDLIWKPEVVSHLTDKDIDLYSDLACTACVTGGGRNIEYALHLLHRSNGNIKMAITKLLNSKPEEYSPQDPLYNYPYTEDDIWTIQEIETYNMAIVKYEKNFYLIAQEVKTKTVKQCVQFYYFWKKVCTSDYDRMRNTIYQREGLSNKINTSNNNQPRKNCEMDQDLNNNVSASKPANDITSNIRVHTHHVSGSNTGAITNRASTPSTSSMASNPHTFKDPHAIIGTEEFPCKVCGRIFYKIKSRSAHMKRHKNEHGHSTI